MVRHDSGRARPTDGPAVTTAGEERALRAPRASGARLPPYYAERLEAIRPAAAVSVRRKVAALDSEAEALRLLRDFKLGLLTLVVMALLLLAYFWDGGREGAARPSSSFGLLNDPEALDGPRSAGGPGKTRGLPSSRAAVLRDEGVTNNEGVVRNEGVPRHEGVLTMKLRGERRSQATEPLLRRHLRQAQCPRPEQVEGRRPVPIAPAAGRAGPAAPGQRLSRCGSAAQAGAFVYTVRRGDTLSAVALRFYGEPGGWRLILAANRGRLRRPSDLRPGMRILVPARPVRRAPPGPH